MVCNTLCRQIWWSSSSLCGLFKFILFHQANSNLWLPFLMFSRYSVLRSHLLFPSSGHTLGPCSLPRTMQGGTSTRHSGELNSCAPSHGTIQQVSCALLVTCSWVWRMLQSFSLIWLLSFCFNLLVPMRLDEAGLFYDKLMTFLDDENRMFMFPGKLQKNTTLSFWRV